MIRLRVPGSLTYRHLAVRVVAAACHMAASQSKRPASRSTDAEPSLHDLVGASMERPEDEFEFQTVSAFGEAFNNIALHSYRDVPLGDIDMEIEADEDGIVIRLMDTGKSFDPASVAPPAMEDLPESGMGLFIMRSCMDQVEYSPGSPNVLRLAKRRDGPSLSGDGGDGEGGVRHIDDSDGDDFADPPAEDDRVSGHSGIRMRSVARTSPQRAAGGIKIQ